MRKSFSVWDPFKPGICHRLFKDLLGVFFAAHDDDDEDHELKHFIPVHSTKQEGQLHLNIETMFKFY